MSAELATSSAETMRMTGKQKVSVSIKPDLLRLNAVPSCIDFRTC